MTDLRADVTALLDLADELGRSHAGTIEWLNSPTTYLGGDRPITRLARGETDLVLETARNAWGIEW